MMTMQFSEVLEGLSIITWEQATATHIRQSMVAAGVEPPMDELRVWTNIVRQTPIRATVTDPSAPAVASATQADAVPPAVRRRSLQATVPLRIAFDTAVSYRSTGTDHNLQELIASAFDTEDDREAYMTSLKRTNDGAFQTLKEISTVSVGGVDVAVPVPVQEESTDMTIFIIIGACAGGGALLLLILFLFWKNYAGGDRGSTLGKTEAISHGNLTGSTANNGVTTEIVMEQDRDDVSTLGDPMGGMYSPNGGMMMNTMDRDERTASVADDYDYKYLKHHNFNNNPDNPNRDKLMSEDDGRSRMNSEDNLTRDSSGKTSQSKLGFSQMGESIFSDDASFEEQYSEPDEQVPFEITVPAGKLGMVIDTPNGGFPIVHAIKDTSILSEKVRVGDRLVSVDGQDCTTMTAVQVSKLISLKSDQDSRILVFVRSRTRPNPAN